MTFGFRLSRSLVFLTGTLLLTTFAHSQPKGFGPSLAEYNGTDTNNHGLGLDKRGGKRFTFFEPGMGACGVVNKKSDSIVALNSAQWDGGSHCFKMITVKCGGKTKQAQITDECPGCPRGGLDMSPGLFGFFGLLDLGVLYGDWSFTGENNIPTTPAKPSAAIADIDTLLGDSEHSSASKQNTTSARTAQHRPTPTVVESLLLPSLTVLNNAIIPTNGAGPPTGAALGEGIRTRLSASRSGASETASHHNMHKFESALISSPSATSQLNAEEAQGNLQLLNRAAVNLGSLAGNARLHRKDL